MREEPFGVRIGDGSLAGCAASEGAPALLLHGGPAIPDYMGPCALELEGLFATIRYTQRGVPPSTVGSPYSIESHMADALAVLDARGLERAWAIGHSWGGHLALHLLVSHPERLLGVVCVDPLGAFDAFAELGANMQRRLSPDERERAAEIQAKRDAGEATEQEVVERWGIMWPQYFLHDELASAPPRNVGPRCSTDTNASIAEHFEQRTLELGLPEARLPVLVVHGAQSPLPIESAERTAALIPGTVFETVDDCGHFPWIEQPGAVRQALERFL
ncbi:MAG TPA: alpha/beta hydrolase [Gaiellaceae bacterium]|nr:alpha/beta hydrolase [Gaiellaceae bacterium]